MLSPAAHTTGRRYCYRFLLYQDLGPQHEMRAAGTVSVMGTDRQTALEALNLPADRRAVMLPPEY